MSSDRTEQIKLLNDQFTGALFKSLGPTVLAALLDARRTCVHCVHAKGQNGSTPYYYDNTPANTVLRCGRWDGAPQPPPYVIAFGCQEFLNDDIPF